MPWQISIYEQKAGCCKKVSCKIFAVCAHRMTKHAGITLLWN